MSFILNKYVITVLVVIVCVVIGIVSIKFLGNDNPVEEAAEAVIKEEVGIDVDLSKETPETQTPSIVPPDAGNSSAASLGTPP
jgi:hypothetical protein